MKNEHRNSLVFLWLRSALLLVILYSGQLHPFHHLHHFHDEGVAESTIYFHPIEIDVEHSSGHHHDGGSPHTDDHRHTFDSHIDWHTARAQNPRILTLDDQRLFSSLSAAFTDDNSISRIDCERFIFIDSDDVPSSIIRGPPALG